jgi:cytochrome c-type biogenesis protein CcmH
MRRREFLVLAAGSGGALAALAVSRRLGAQQQVAPQPNFGPMDGTAYRATYRPAKPGVAPSMTDLERDALEKRLKCQCTCTLDVYTCRTTDFTCPVSPAMHADVMRLVAGGHTADEILDAFVETYGEVALMAPKKEGFNWAGYFAPAVALATGGVVLTMMLRRWSRDAQAGQAARAAAAASGGATSGGAPAAPVASADELARLERALREDA